MTPPDPAVRMEPLRWLDQDQRGLEAADVVRIEKLRHDFLAEVSHELKTPVGAVALLAEAVLDAADDPHQVRRFGTKILHEANRLGTLVTELIALSRLQSAERLPELSTVDVKDVVDQALARCRPAIESANIQITLDSPTGLLLIGDAALLVTALSNLIHNAVSYSAPGSPVSVSARLANDLVEIIVTDQGRGIEPEYQQRIFERFFRVDQALSRSTGGTGWDWRSSSVSRPTTVVTYCYGVNRVSDRPSPCESPISTSRPSLTDVIDTRVGTRVALVDKQAGVRARWCHGRQLPRCAK